MSLLEHLEARFGSLAEPRARAVLLALLQNPLELSRRIRQDGSALAALDMLAVTGDHECKRQNAKCKVQNGQASWLSATMRLRTRLRRDFGDHPPSQDASAGLRRPSAFAGRFGGTSATITFDCRSRRPCLEGRAGREDKRKDSPLHMAERELAGLERLGVTLLLPGGPHWPPLLEQSVNPPALLHVRGVPEALSKGPSLALVGSRCGAAYGTRVADALAQAWCAMGGTVVSGGARGVDSAAHRGALTAGGTTVAVLGSGLATPYPPENRELFATIAERGAVASELPLTGRPLPFSFPLRNRIIAGLSQAVVVVQARKGSGALHTATFALQCSRLLFTVPGPVDDDVCAGGLELLAQGIPAMTGHAQLEQLFSELTGRAPGPSSPLPLRPREKPTVSSAALEPRDRRILEILSAGPTHVDDLAGRLGVEHGPLSLVLLELEVKRWIRREAGNQYRSNVQLER
jgi:DNA processing protein